MSRTRCFFIGHRDAPRALYEKLKTEVKRLVIYENVSEFVVGKYGSFDAIASSAVLDVKTEYPQINLLRLTPYYSPTRAVQLPSGFDGTIYPDGLEKVPRRFSIVRANQYMIEHSDYLICYVCHSFGNASKLVEFASRKESNGKLHIIRL